MSDPLALFSLALAAGGGRINQWPAGQLVAAGHSLRQRSPALVRALDGRRTAILLPTSAQYVTALAASDGHGAVLINPLASATEIAWQLADANVGAVFTNAALESRIPATVVRVLLDDAPETARVLQGSVASRVDLGSHWGLPLEGDSQVEGRDEEAVVVYTSAMAGVPLGAILTHRNLLSNARATVAAAHDGPTDHSLAVLPFAHLFGLIVAAGATLLAGGRVTTMERFKPTAVLDIVEQQGITRLVGVPSMYASLLQAIEYRGTPFNAPALRLCVCGGALLPREWQARWHDVTGVDLRQGYGLTETSPVALLNGLDEPNRIGRLGTPIAGVDVTIRHPATGALVALEEEGEICVRGPNVFRGYVSGGDAGLRGRNGWLHSGDLGAQFADRSVEFRGLLKPMFTRNGFNVYPREVETVVAAMPGVQVARVRALPDALKEHSIALDVTGNVTEDDVRRWCTLHLGQYKQPTTIAIL